MDFATRYKKLNARQKEAVDTIEGPLMVVAGPGTGKTELLSMRAANILRKTDTLPENILCLTFTESGAAAMRQRLGEIIGPAAYKVAIHTFHSFGSEIINQYGEYFYQGAAFRPADELSSYELLYSIFDSLEYSNPLASKMNGDYTHLRDTLGTISDLKKSGLTSDELLAVLDINERTIDVTEPALAAIFAERISKATAGKLAVVARDLASQDTPQLPPGIAPLANILSLSLAHAIDAAEEADSTKPVTAWKNTYLEKNERGEFVFKDRRRIAKLRAVSFVYYQYLMKMQESELYDFDDMVLRVVHAMEVFEELRLNLQERYLYIMVDEFQDTNMAQARILYNLTANPTGDEPNIMVVGDDDQAIYSFQGAEVGNILSFRDRYESVKLVTLADNYRSADLILEKARSVITLGEQRLERFVEEIDKTLVAHHAPKHANVQLREYEHPEDERRALAASIKQQLDEGTDGANIAVLARRHHELTSLIPYFYALDIPVNYERRDNVLEADVIQQLLTLVRVVTLTAASRIDEADALLPELLAHPAWGVDAEAIWSLSLAAYKHRSSWREELAIAPAWKPFHDWLAERVRDSLTLPLETVLDELIGLPGESENRQAFHSPLYGHFFSDERRAHNPEQYLVYLEAVRTIRTRLREYKPMETLKLSDFIEFIELHQRIGSVISSVRVRSDAPSGAINLMTAHKAKGLEFDHVYIYGAVDSAWGERVRVRSRLIGYPENLPIGVAGDSFDERLRLFFVAMTRARSTLTISYSLSDTSDKPTLRASFLNSDGWEVSSPEVEQTVTATIESLEREWRQPLLALPKTSMKELLAPLLADYKLSATHLNNFIDVTRGGPQHFLLNNLLHFPQAISPNAAYGSALHQALHRAHSHRLATHKAKPIEDILHDFQSELSSMHLAAQEYEQFLRRGEDALETFLGECYETFTDTQLSEQNFNSQQSFCGSAHLTGKLDLVDIDKTTKTIVVTDYKTGKPSSAWRGKTDYEKIKLHKYRQQLMFYKLLIENSRSYHNYAVREGRIQFVEPTPDGTIYQLDLTFDQKELDRFARLVEAVYGKITTLDLPDSTAYAATYQGILDFEDSLLVE